MNYAKALFRGRFTDCEAKSAFGNFESLGKRYLNCSMPPWLRRQLGSGFLTPLAKAEAAPGETADARTTKAEDIDTALWCQALQRLHTPKPKIGEAIEGIRKHLQPRQLSVGVSGGCQILVLGLKLKIEEAFSKGLKCVLVSLVLKNVHNAFSRSEGTWDPRRDRSIAPPASPRSPRDQQPVQPDLHTLGILRQRPTTPL